MQLNVYIASASDGVFTIKAVQMPELSAQARTLEEIPDVVRSAAAAISGQPAAFFDVVIDFQQDRRVQVFPQREEPVLNSEDNSLTTPPVAGPYNL